MTASPNHPPASAASNTAPASSPAALWSEVLRLASNSRRLRALADSLSLASFENDKAELSVSPALAALARSSIKELEELLTKAADRPIAVVIRTPEDTSADGQSTATEAKAQPAQDIRQHPLVKAAEDLFGARVVRVEARPQ